MHNQPPNAANEMNTAEIIHPRFVRKHVAFIYKKRLASLTDFIDFQKKYGRQVSKWPLMGQNSGSCDVLVSKLGQVSTILTKHHTNMPHYPINKIE
jgi:hypothetical protein